MADVDGALVLDNTLFVSSFKNQTMPLKARPVAAGRMTTACGWRGGVVGNVS